MAGVSFYPSSHSSGTLRLIARPVNTVVKRLSPGKRSYDSSQVQRKVGLLRLSQNVQSSAPNRKCRTWRKARQPTEELQRVRSRDVQHWELFRATAKEQRPAMGSRLLGCCRWLSLPQRRGEPTFLGTRRIRSTSLTRREGTYCTVAEAIK
jgi:hypothetical protein